MGLLPKAFSTPRTAHRMERGAIGALSLSMGVSTAGLFVRVEGAVLGPGFDMMVGGLCDGSSGEGADFASLPQR